MIKKVCLVFLALVVVLLAAAGVAWKINGERWQQEYAAFRKTGAPVLMYPEGAGLHDCDGSRAGRASAAGKKCR